MYLLSSNEVKCAWMPSHRLQRLGFIMYLSVGCISVPDQKIVALKSILRSIAGRNVLSAKCIASFVGKIISMGLVLGPI